MKKWYHIRRPIDLRKLFIISLSSFLLLWFLLWFVPPIGGYFLHTIVSQSRLDSIRERNAERIHSFHTSELTIGDIKNTSTSWSRVSYTYKLFDQMRTDKKAALNLQERCSTMSDIDRIGDEECRAEWMHYLESGRIASIVYMMGFSWNKQGGFVVGFEDGRRAMFKPCGSGTEFPENEIKASHIDHVMGFNRVPPSVSRNVSVATFEAIVDNTSKMSMEYHTNQLVLKQMKDTCAFDDGRIFVGTMIGWINQLEDTKTFLKETKLGISEAKILKLRDTLDPVYLGEVVQNHYFFYVVGTVRRELGKNEYKIPSGEMFPVDLDRSSWSLPKIKTDLTACLICKIRRDTLTNVQEAAKRTSFEIALNNSLIYDRGRIQFKTDELNNLQKRLHHILTCYEDCLAKYPESDIVIE